MSLRNLLHQTVWMCPFCSWSLYVTGDEHWDLAGIEAALTDHLDTEHKNWTLQDIFTAMGYD